MVVIDNITVTTEIKNTIFTPHLACLLHLYRIQIVISSRKDYRHIEEYPGILYHLEQKTNAQMNSFCFLKRSSVNS